MKLIYVDTETTGLLPKECGLIQIAGTIVNGTVYEDFDFHIKPFTGARIDDGAMKANGKTAADLAAYPEDGEVFKHFMNILCRYIDRYDSTDKFQIIGYNIDFDVDFIREWFQRNGNSFYSSFFWNPPLDVMTLAAWNLIGARSTLKNFKLGTVYEHYLGKPMIDAHDAFADACAARAIANRVFAIGSPF